MSLGRGARGHGGVVCPPRHPLTKAPAPLRPLPHSTGIYLGCPPSFSPPAALPLTVTARPPPSLSFLPPQDLAGLAGAALRGSGAAGAGDAGDSHHGGSAAPLEGSNARPPEPCRLWRGFSLPFPRLPFLSPHGSNGCPGARLVAPTIAVICFFQYTSTGRLYLPPTPSSLAPFKVCSLKGRFFYSIHAFAHPFYYSSADIFRER